MFIMLWVGGWRLRRENVVAARGHRASPSSSSSSAASAAVLAHHSVVLVPSLTHTHWHRSLYGGCSGSLVRFIGHVLMSWATDDHLGYLERCRRSTLHQPSLVQQSMSPARSDQLQPMLQVASVWSAVNCEKLTGDQQRSPRPDRPKAAVGLKATSPLPTS